jgi:predicted transcriptional regulator
MLPEIEEIGRRRKNLELTQKKLASLAGVSQSLIAKIESGGIDASYRKIKRIFEALEKEEKRKEKRMIARDLSNRRIIGVDKRDPVSKAIKLMQKNGFSQLPVWDENLPVGCITEKGITSYILERRDLRRLPELDVAQLMEDSLPQVSEETPIEAVTALLQHSPAVLTIKEGKATGIITKADLLKVFR